MNETMNLERPYTSKKEAMKNPEIKKIYQVVEGKISVVENKLAEAKEQIVKLENVMKETKQMMIKVKNMGSRIVAEGANFKGIKVSDEEKKRTAQSVLGIEAKYNEILKSITELSHEISVKPIEKSSFDENFDKMLLSDSEAEEEARKNEQGFAEQSIKVSPEKENGQNAKEKIDQLLNQLDNLENFSLRALAQAEVANQSVKSSDEMVNIKLSNKEREIEQERKNVNEQARELIKEIGEVITSAPESIKESIQKEIFNWRINQEIKELEKENAKITVAIQQVRRKVAEENSALELKLKQVYKPTVGEVSREQASIDRRAGELIPLVKQSTDIQQQIKQLEAKLKK